MFVLHFISDTISKHYGDHISRWFIMGNKVPPHITTPLRVGQDTILVDQLVTYVLYHSDQVSPVNTDMKGK